jgi:hypothetical protein
VKLSTGWSSIPLLTPRHLAAKKTRQRLDRVLDSRR